MSWTDNYIEASFRTVSFFVERAMQVGGRRLVEHELVDVDDAQYEDLGRKNRTFTITAYLVGPHIDPKTKAPYDYYTARDNLVEALEAPGSGVLTHPYRGDLEVRCIDYTVTETKQEGRYCQFDITFKWVKDKDLLLILPDQQANTLVKQASFLDKLSNFLDDAYDLASMPGEVIQDAIDAINTAMDYVEKVKKVVGAYDEFQRKIATLRGKTLEIGLDAQKFNSKMKEIILFGTNPTTPINEAVAFGEFARDQYYEMKTLVAFDEEDLTQYPTIAAQNTVFPTTLIQKQVARTALAARVSLIPNMEIKSVQQAEEIVTDTSVQVAKIEADLSADVELVEAARDLRVAIEKMIEERKLTLNQLNTIQVLEPEPAMVTAYDLYGDSTRDEEICDLNDVVDPCFLVGEGLAVYAN